MSTFVGRARELEWLAGRLARARAGHGGVVLVSGDAGAGKSTMVQQFLLDVAGAAPDVRILTATCSEQYGADEPYQPFVEAVRQLARQPEGGARRSFGELARELAPYWLQAVPVAGNLLAAATATAFELKRTFGVGAPAAAPPSEEALFFQYTELLLAAAQVAPLVLFLDDLHWADRASIALLGHLGRRIADERVLILGTYRAADVEVARHPLKQARLELERYGAAEELALAPLDSAALAHWVAAELDAPVAPELVRWLERRAGTNPLFFGELLKWAVEQGIAGRHADEWVLLRRPAEIDIPRSAESVIEKRLGRLEPEIYRVLEYASVEGDTFHSTILARLLGQDELALEEALEPMARVHRLIRLVGTEDLPDGDVASVYEFGHSLIQDVLHTAIRGKRRILLHRKVAEILEAIWSADTAQIAQRLAIHYDEGRLAERAYRFSLLAAERAERVYAHSDAIDLLRRALRNAGASAERLEAYERIGRASRRVGRFPEALQALGEALALAEAAGDEPRALRLRRQILQVESECGGRDAGQLQAELTRLHDRALALDARSELCEILWQFRRLPGAGGEAVARAETALALVAEAGPPELVARASLELGTAQMLFGRPAEAGPYFERALALYQQLEDRAQIAICRNHLGITRVLRGDYAGAAAAFAEAVLAYEAAGDPVGGASVRNNLGALLIRLGDWSRAESMLQEAVRISRRLDMAARVLHPLENLARLEEARGAWTAAESGWLGLLEHARTVGYWNVEAIARCGLGLARLEQGDVAAARAALRDAGALLHGREGWSEAHALHHLLEGRLAAQAGDLPRAARILEEAERELAARDPFETARFRLLRAELLWRRDPGAARAALLDARDALTRLGAEPLLRRAEALLREMEEAA